MHGGSVGACIYFAGDVYQLKLRQVQPVLTADDNFLFGFFSQAFGEILGCNVVTKNGKLPKQFIPPVLCGLWLLPMHRNTLLSNI